MTTSTDYKHYVSTLLWICGDGLNVDLINQKLGAVDPSIFQKPTIVRKGEWSIQPDEKTNRIFDSRIYLDRWCKGLTQNQSKWSLEKQLEFWLTKLYPVRAAFQEFKQLGYWSVIDCQLTAKNQELPSIQFRLTQELQLKFSKLSIDLDFTIYRPTIQV